MIFPCFWLVKAKRIIHHNQLLLTKFGKNVIILNRWRQNDVKGTAFLEVIEPLTVKTWGRGWIVLVVRTKWRNCRGTFYSSHGKIFSKNIARTEEDNSTDNICYEYICWPEQTLTKLSPDKDALSICLNRPRIACFSLFLNLELFWRNNKTIIEFAFRWIWRVLPQIEEGVGGLGG